MSFIIINFSIPYSLFLPIDLLSSAVTFSKPKGLPLKFPSREVLLKSDFYIFAYLEIF